ncbi:hypothetical protein Tco_1406149 [Tanacetum coccineum]
MESSNSNSEEKELQHMQLVVRKLHQKSMDIFKELESHLKTLYPISGFFVTHKRLFEATFLTLFGEELQNFRKKMFHNLDQLRLQFERENFHEVNAKTCLEVLQTQFKDIFFASKGYLDILAKRIDKRVLQYGELRMKESEVKAIKETEKLLNEAIPHEHEIKKNFKLQSKDVQINPVQAVGTNLVGTESSGIKSENNSSENALSKSVNQTQMQMQEGKVDMGKALVVGLVDTESSGTKSDKQDTISRSGNDIDADDADIKPVYDEKRMAEVQLTADKNVFATGQQHTEKPKFNNKGQVDQDAEQCHDKSLLLAKLTDNQINSQINLLNLKILVLKRLNEAKVKKDIDDFETINIELEHGVAKLLTENEHLLKENEHLKKTYKHLYDSIKKTRVQIKDHNDSLIAPLNKKSIENIDLKAQIQEKVFANASLKNKLKKSESEYSVEKSESDFHLNLNK